MWPLKKSPGLLTDLYELTMAQGYFKKGEEGTAYFEVFIRTLPENWGFFVMAGLAECSVDAVVTDPPYGLKFMGRN